MRGLLFVSACLEREKGIEPSLFAWEAKVLPLNDSRNLAIVLSEVCAAVLAKEVGQQCKNSGKKSSKNSRWGFGLAAVWLACAGHFSYLWMSPMHRYLIST